MLEISQLEQLLVFAKFGTLSKAAEELHISQPSLSRTMQQIEGELGVSLFVRQKNRIALNENGQLAAEYAQKVFNQLSDMVFRIRTFDRMNNTISLGSCAPMPGIQMVQRLRRAYPDVTISSEIKGLLQLKNGLLQGTYQFIILPAAYGQTPKIDGCTAVPFSEEHLMFALPETHPKAHAKSLSLADINGQNVILMPNIGFWQDILDKKMPDSHFLVQTDRTAFTDLIAASVLPYFTSNLSMNEYTQPDGRLLVPITDPEVNVTFYFIAKENDRKKFAKIFSDR